MVGPLNCKHFIRLLIVVGMCKGQCLSATVSKNYRRALKYTLPDRLNYTQCDKIHGMINIT